MKVKIKITYETEDELKAVLNTPMRDFIRNGAKLKTDTKTEFKHAYINIGRPTKKTQQP